MGNITQIEILMGISNRFNNIFYCEASVLRFVRTNGIIMQPIMSMKVRKIQNIIIYKIAMMELIRSFKTDVHFFFSDSKFTKDKIKLKYIIHLFSKLSCFHQVLKRIIFHINYDMLIFSTELNV